MNSIKLVALAFIVMLLAACTGQGVTTHGSDRICDDPMQIHECRYGGDSDGGEGEGGDGGEGGESEE